MTKASAEEKARNREIARKWRAKRRLAAQNNPELAAKIQAQNQAKASHKAALGKLWVRIGFALPPAEYEFLMSETRRRGMSTNALMRLAVQKLGDSGP